MEEEAAAVVAVVIVPLPAQGHLNQLLHLSRLLAQRRLPVHFAASPTHIRQAQLRVEGWDPVAASSLHFHPLPLPSFPTPQPNPLSPHKFPDHLLPALHATNSFLRQPLSALLRSLSASHHRVAVILEPLTSFAAVEAALHPRAESYLFYPLSAIFNLHSLGHPEAEDDTFHLPTASLDGCASPLFLDFLQDRREELVASSIAGYLLNTCAPVEAQFLQLLAQGPLAQVKIFPIGPLNPVKSSAARRHWCLDWLDKQPPNSVIYVSFGTASTLPDEQVTELGLGLERSGQRFVWVLREADRGDIFKQAQEDGDDGIRRFELPRGFEERVRGRGLVVGDWAPQLAILGHGSVGGFMSHCGWNSCMESISMGVPMAAWPFHSDQPANAVLVTMVLGIGVMVREWANHEEIVGAERVEEVVRTLMGSEEGEEIRRRAAELGGVVRDQWSEDGGSRVALDSFVDHISRGSPKSSVKACAHGNCMEISP